MATVSVYYDVFVLILLQLFCVCCILLLYIVLLGSLCTAVHIIKIIVCVESFLCKNNHISKKSTYQEKQRFGTRLFQINPKEVQILIALLHKYY